MLILNTSTLTSPPIWDDDMVFTGKAMFHLKKCRDQDYVLFILNTPYVVIDKSILKIHSVVKSRITRDSILIDAHIFDGDEYCVYSLRLLEFPIVSLHNHGHPHHTDYRVNYYLFSETRVICFVSVYQHSMCDITFEIGNFTP